MTEYMFRGRENESLNYHPGSSAASSVEASEGQDTPWQLVPPIITSGRMAAIRPNTTTPAPTRDIYSQPQTPVQANEDTPLFRVSFAGPDQQWYRVSIGARQARQNMLVAPPAWQASSVVTPEAAPYIEQDAPSKRCQPRPAWREEEDVANTTWGGVREKWQQGVRPGLPPAEQPEMLVRPLGTNSSQHPAWQAQTRSTPLPEQAEETNKDFLLQIVQPGLAGLMDGSVSTLAPIFAVAFATHKPFTVFLVGMASALGAGISMTFSEALSDDGEITGRGKPFIRGGVTGLMTFLSGAGHALPFLIQNIQLALIMAYVVVALELLAIAAIRHKFFGTKWWLSIVQVVGGGLLVFLAALLLGNA